MSTSHIEPPDPHRTVLENGHVIQYYSSFDDALRAAAYSHGYLTDPEPDDGEYAVKWDLR